MQLTVCQHETKTVFTPVKHPLRHPYKERGNTKHWQREELIIKTTSNTFNSKSTVIYLIAESQAKKIHLKHMDAWFHEINYFQQSRMLKDFRQSEPIKRGARCNQRKGEMMRLDWFQSPGEHWRQCVLPKGFKWTRNDGLDLCLTEKAARYKWWPWPIRRRRMWLSDEKWHQSAGISKLLVF